MKPLFKYLIAICILGMAYVSKAQESSFGIHLGYGTEIESMGIGAKANVALSDQFRLAPGAFMFFPNTTLGVKTTWYEVNLDGQLMLGGDGMSVYPFGGLNVSIFSTNWEAFGTKYSDSSSEIGVNLGVGLQLEMGGILPFFEGKYVIIKDWNQLVLSGGIAFPF